MHTVSNRCWDSRVTVYFADMLRLIKIYCGRRVWSMNLMNRRIHWICTSRALKKLVNTMYAVFLWQWRISFYSTALCLHHQRFTVCLLWMWFDGLFEGTTSRSHKWWKSNNIRAQIQKCNTELSFLAIYSPLSIYSLPTNIGIKPWLENRTRMFFS